MTKQEKLQILNELIDRATYLNYRTRLEMIRY